jgi:hypothetical protein
MHGFIEINGSNTYETVRVLFNQGSDLFVRYERTFWPPPGTQQALVHLSLIHGGEGEGNGDILANMVHAHPVTQRCEHRMVDKRQIRVLHPDIYDVLILYHDPPSSWKCLCRVGL